MITKEEALEALDAMDDYARMDVGVDAYGPRGVLMKFIEQESFCVKQVPDGWCFSEEGVGAFRNPENGEIVYVSSDHKVADIYEEVLIIPMKREK